MSQHKYAPYFDTDDLFATYSLECSRLLEVSSEMRIRLCSGKYLAPYLDQFACFEHRSWPAAVRASERQLRSRFEAFPEGAFAAVRGDTLVGLAFCQIVSFSGEQRDESLMDLMPMYDSCQSRHAQSGNCIHLMACAVDPTHRGLGLWKRLIEARLHLARKLELGHAMVDIRLSGYLEYAQSHLGCTVQTYAQIVDTGGVPVDRNQRVFWKFGFEYYRLLPSTYIDVQSGNHWLFMLHELEDAK